MRRRSVVLALAGTVIAAVAGGFAVWRTGPTAVPADPGASETSAPTLRAEPDSAPPPGPVIRLQGARDAARGRDFTVLTSLTNENLERANGRYLGPFTPDGLLVIQDGPRGLTNSSRWELLDPRTGSLELLPDAPGTAAAGEVIGGVDRRLVWHHASQAGVTVQFSTFDRDTRGWHTVTVATDRLRDQPVDVTDWSFPQARVAADGRAYFASAEMRGQPATLWSVSLRGRTELRREGTVGWWDVSGRLLASAESGDDGTKLRITNLATGREVRRDLRLEAGCGINEILVSPEAIGLAQYCQEDSSGVEGRVLMLSPSGRPRGTIMGPGLELGALTGPRAVIRGDGDVAAGAYVFDLRDGSLLRLADRIPRYFYEQSVHHRTVVWATPVNRSRGLRYWVARLN